MQLLLLADKGLPFSTERVPLVDWPWSWLRALSYAKIAQGVMERAQMDEKPDEALPPKWMWWRRKELDAWFDERREAQRNARRT